MESTGFMVKKDILLDLEKSLEKDIDLLSKDIYNLAGTEFNISSSQQMADVLFNQMGIDPHKKSRKSGAYSTSVEILEQLQAEGHTIADLLIRWRRLSKIKSTYTSALVNYIESSQSGERIHSNFSLALTSTGRFSSTEPNLQNIPVRGEFADEIRSAFVARKGYKILALDYSQVELRIVAAMANVASLKEAFRKNLDIHSVTAGEIFGVKTEDVDKSLRNKAKAINFGIIYGISGFGLAKNIGISRSEATDYINKYFERYPEILSFMESSKEFAIKHGYVETIMGRRCYISNINSKDSNVRSLAERAAINFPIQGSSSDIMRKAMVKVGNVLKSPQLDCKMILQVHDELLFEVKESEVDSASKVLQRSMEQIIDLSVPLVVNTSIGENWRKV
jgi:DNA polymerase-1